jgi:dTMP kinase
MQVNKALLIVNEGVDGSGKTTASRLLSEQLLKDGIENIVVQPLKREDSFLKECHQSKAFYLSAGEKEGSKTIERFYADYFSMVLINNIIMTVIPHLEKGISVVCDRYYYSHWVNQAFFGACVASKKELWEPLPKPDVVFYHDISVKTALERLSSRKTKGVGDNKNFLSSSIEQFLQLSHTYSFFRVDATKPKGENVSTMISEIRRLRKEMPHDHNH